MRGRQRRLRTSILFSEGGFCRTADGGQAFQMGSNEDIAFAFAFKAYREGEGGDCILE
jgi:hypothetical protein